MLRRRLLIAAALFVGFSALFSIPLSMPIFTRGEAREALVVQAMFDQQNLILPLRNGADIPSKPPLFHWAGYAFSNLFLQNEFAFRLPSALASACTIATFFLLFSARYSQLASLLAVFTLATSMDWLRTSIGGRVDQMFALWVSLATWLLFLVIERVRTDQTTPWNLVSLSGFAMGLAVLTKGPAGLALPGIVASIYALLALPPRQLPILAALASALMAVAVSGTWYIAAYSQGGERFLDVHLMRENLARVIGMDEYEVGHEAGPLTIIPLILGGLLPWSFFLVPGLAALKSHWRSLRTSPDVLFAVIWATFYLVFFAVTVSKRNVYLLPSFPAYAILLAIGIDNGSLARSSRLPAVGWMFAVFTAVITIALVTLIEMRFVDISSFLAMLDVKARDIEAIKRLGSPEPSTLALLSFALVLLIAGTRKYFHRHLEAAITSTGAAQLLIALALYLGVMPKIANLQTPKNELTRLTAILPPRAPLYQFRQEFYAIDYYLRRVVPTIHSRPTLPNSMSGFLLVDETEVSEACAALGSCEKLAKSEGLILYGRTRVVLLKFS